LIEQLVAKETKNRPVWRCVPATRDEEDINAAKVGDRFLTWVWHEKGMDHKWVQMKLWTRVVGKVFMKVYWDPTEGDEVTVYGNPETGEPATQEELDAAAVQGLAPEQAFLKQSFRLGDICVRVCPFDRVLVDP